MGLFPAFQPVFASYLTPPQFQLTITMSSPPSDFSYHARLDPGNNRAYEWNIENLKGKKLWLTTRKYDPTKLSMEMDGVRVGRISGSSVRISPSFGPADTNENLVGSEVTELEDMVPAGAPEDFLDCLKDIKAESEKLLGYTGTYRFHHIEIATAGTCTGASSSCPKDWAKWTWQLEKVETGWEQEKVKTEWKQTLREQKLKLRKLGQRGTQLTRSYVARSLGKPSQKDSAQESGMIQQSAD